MNLQNKSKAATRQHSLIQKKLTLCGQCDGFFVKTDASILAYIALALFATPPWYQMINLICNPFRWSPIPVIHAETPCSWGLVCKCAFLSLRLLLPLNSARYCNRDIAWMRFIGSSEVFRWCGQLSACDTFIFVSLCFYHIVIFHVALGKKTRYKKKRGKKGSWCVMMPFHEFYRKCK